MAQSIKDITKAVATVAVKESMAMVRIVVAVIAAPTQKKKFPSLAPLQHLVFDDQLFAATRSGKLQNRSRYRQNEDGGLLYLYVRLWLRNARRDLVARFSFTGQPRSSHSDYRRPWLCRCHWPLRHQHHRRGLVVSFFLTPATMLPDLQE